MIITDKEWLENHTHTLEGLKISVWHNLNQYLKQKVKTYKYKEVSFFLYNLSLLTGSFMFPILCKLKFLSKKKIIRILAMEILTS